MTPIPFRVHALPADVLADVRTSEVDALGNRVERLIAAGGEALRCCLRDAEAGAELILFGYQPPLPPSPYRETGAVYAHARPCAGPGGLDGYPPAWRGRRQVLRAYDDRGWIHDARVHDGQDPEAVIAEVLADPAVVQVHSRNVAYGCYMFTVTRAPSPARRSSGSR
ncbi:MAG TPA: DUF1203 domain-containing protein [Actinophytocola sp.]|nr:DUF1203 domain-containing protein [Actinophytocola sp.]